ncbi:fungal specific transcription factor domain-containing protein [Colletotrichum graminicola M1.001]|uniref:Fungal specific transcription factor domain-containing protein n=1 Tax=Colletotrichum graminicola (strain M1.001 / M2 / FGSC 10212) TaxID=645133 RepID=E3Q7L2_COLGM|nr:fungal specific transcription factor domain-containing protein [Colletotrichum graminicola M1.001]EFQ26850.1 fungal specific transcription factor domain-containing protein [Colletotrichum graminicola M1.001]
MALAKSRKNKGIGEKKIDLIEERLSNIEELLRSLVNDPQGASNVSWDGNRVRHATPSASTVGDLSILTQDDADSDSAFEGELSLTAHTMFASDFIEDAVQRTSLRDVPPNMHAALSSLRQIVTMQSKVSSTREFRFRTQQLPPPGGLTDLPMPPMNAVVALLKHMKVSPPSIFSLACSFLDVDDLAELCRKIYFCTDNFADTTFVIVNGALFYLFMEQSYLAPNAEAREEFERYQHICQSNLETALTCLPLMLPAKRESIEALLLAAVYSIDVSKASLAWLFTSTAASLCQTLGYHRVSQARSESAGPRDIKTLLFWHVYMLDKTLSLRTGRASVIQDWDITLPRRVDNTMVADPWGAIITTWIKQAEIAHRVYEQLYSPLAIHQSQEERIETVRRLESEQKAIMAAGSHVREQVLFGLKAMNASSILDIHLRGDEMSFHSTMTLIYRALPAPEGSPTRFSQECIDTARFAMQLHLECMQKIAEEGRHLKAVYIHWAILLTPFTPFFVLFCHVIDTSNADDLRRLNEFVASLRPACGLSEPVEKLHQLCSMLCNVATLYMESKSQQSEERGPINDEFDVYLSALGFPPAEYPAQGMDTSDMSQPSLQTAQLGNWFSGSQYMMGLLEEDLSQFN